MCVLDAFQTKLNEYFDILDINGDGAIDKREMSMLLSEVGCSEESIEEMWNKYKRHDLNGDESISRSEVHVSVED